MAKKKGLGDLIAAVTEAVGIEPCVGCDKRKETLNKIKIFQFGTEELTEDEKAFLSTFFATEQDEILYFTQRDLLKIYFRVYRVTPFEPCDGCSGVLKSIIKKLKKLDYE